MTLRPCSCEKEVTELLARGQRPEAFTQELRAHVRGCRSCTDLALVTEAFQRSRSETAAAANLRPHGALWWRAQLRRRNEAVKRVARPMLGAQIFALSLYLSSAAGFLVSQARHGLQWLSWLEQLSKSQVLHVEALWPSALFNWTPMLLIPALAALALVGGVAVCLAAEKQ